MKAFIKIFYSICIVLLFSSVSVAKNQRFALVIGNSDYKTAPLKNPVNDAVDIAKKLEKFGFQVTLKTNADLKQIEREIRKFGKTLQSGGTGLFYFAGHGIQVKGRNYLVPIGAILESEGDARYEAVDAGLILAKMEDAQNDLNIVILDACRNNPFARSFRSSASGLARMDAPTGSLIAYATAPGSVAADGEGRNGIYTKYLLESMDQPGLTIEQVLKRVRINVINDTQKKQVPWESSSLTGDFYFNNSAGEVIAAPPSKKSRPKKKTQVASLKNVTSLDEILQNTAKIKSTDPIRERKIEDLYYENTKGGSAPAALNYLLRFPNGRYVSDIKAKTFYARTRNAWSYKDRTSNYIYENDSLGRQTSRSLHGKDNNTVYTSFYGEDGRKKKEIMVQKTSSSQTTKETTYEYDDKGLISKEVSKTTIIKAKGKKGPQEKDTYEQVNYSYNDLEQLIQKVTDSETFKSTRKMTYDTEGKLSHTNSVFISTLSKNYRSESNTTYQYDESGKLAGFLSNHTDHKGKTRKSTSKVEYTDAGLIKKKTQYFANGGVSWESFYNSHGLFERSVRYDESGKVIGGEQSSYEPISFK